MEANELLVQVPQTGYVQFTLVPDGTPIGQGGVVPDINLGLASVTIVKQPGSSGVYGIPPAGSYTGKLAASLALNMLSLAPSACGLTHHAIASI